MQDWMECGGFTPLYFFVAITILFCHNHRKDRFDEPASSFRLDEKADFSVDHQLRSSVFHLEFCSRKTIISFSRLLLRVNRLVISTS